MNTNLVHEPVLLNEAIDSLHLNSSGIYVDGTLGAGGHSKVIIDKGGFVIGIDKDPFMISLAKNNLPESHFTLVNRSFSDIKIILKDLGYEKVDGILLDLGISNVHFSDKSRGFSFSDSTASLDMRLSQSQNLKASDLLNILREDQLTDLFAEIFTGYEARKIAKKIISKREQKRFEIVGDLLAISKDAKIFMALRIAVNSELDDLKKALPDCLEVLKPRGRLVIITFHSTEDRIVKNFFTEVGNSEKGIVITQKPIIPSSEEIVRNPRARSAKLRVIEKI